MSNFVENIKIIYLLPGDTMMSIDSAHSTIESYVRRLTILALSEWLTTTHNARTNLLGYIYIKIGHTEFENWKSFANSLLPNRLKGPIHYTSLLAQSSDCASRLNVYGLVVRLYKLIV